MDDEVDSDDVDKVEVECSVDEEVDDLFASIPPLVDPDVPFGYLQPGGNPYVVYRYVDSRDENGDANLEAVCFPLICEEDGASVDDDLQEELDLQGPCRN